MWMETKPLTRRSRSPKHARNPRTIHPQRGKEELEIFGGERGLGHGVDELAEPAGPPVPLYRQEKFEPEISGLRLGDFRVPEISGAISG